MSKGGYRPNSGRKRGGTAWNKGIPMKAESRLKVSLSKKGKVSWNKGIPMSEETKKKLSLAKMGQPSYWKGKRFPKTMREKMSVAKLGKTSPNKGKPVSEEQKKKISESMKGIVFTLELLEKNRQGQYRRYLKLNPNYVVATRNKRIAINGGFHSNKEWSIVKEKFNFTCPSCKKSEPEIKLTRDHILALAMGGTNSIDNIQPLCGKCNTKKHTTTIKY